MTAQRTHHASPRVRPRGSRVHAAAPATIHAPAWRASAGRAARVALARAWAALRNTMSAAGLQER
jgi:hypothetical protein